MARLDNKRTPWPRYSISAAKLYEGCPQRFKYRYRDKVKVERKQAPEPMRFGTVIHAGMEAGHKEARKGAGDSDVLQAAYTAIRESWKAEGMPAIEGELDRALELTERTLEWVGPIEPSRVLGVEHQFLDRLPDGAIVFGWADLIEREGPRAATIVDWKVTGTALSAEDLAADFQLNVYAWLAMQEFDLDEVWVEHRYPTMRKSVRVPSTREGREEAISRMEAVVEMIEGEQAWPAKVGNSCDWCDFKGLCPSYQQEQALLTQALAPPQPADADLAAMRRF